VSAGDWPQILGPHRNGAADGESIVDRLPQGGLPVLWQHGVGSGFAGVAVAGGTVVVFHRQDNTEVVEALRAADGSSIWKATFDTDYQPQYIDDNGPRVVPLIHKSHVYVYGAAGDLHCLDFKTGKVLWSRDTYADYSSKRAFRGEPPDGYFGIGTSPIVEGEQLLVNVGGDAKQAGIVAFALADGKTVWTATSERASYSSPTAATIDGVRHVIFATRLNAVSIDPTTGKTRFQIPFGQPGPKVTGANPLVIDGHLFLSASYGVGAVYAQIKPAAADIVWSNDDVLSSQYTTAVEHDGLLYGIHGRQDSGRASLRCIDPATQEIKWSEDGFGYATLIKADGKLVIMGTEGELVLAQINPREFRELGRAELFQNTTRALPALSDGRLYVRDTHALKCFDLAPRGD
jgi:hypothetical protein